MPQTPFLFIYFLLHFGVSYAIAVTCTRYFPVVGSHVTAATATSSPRGHVVLVARVSAPWEEAPPPQRVVGTRAG